MARKAFYLARRSDGHRFEGSKIFEENARRAEETYTRLGYHLTNLIIVGAGQ